MKTEFCKDCKWWGRDDVIDRILWEIGDDEIDSIPEPPITKFCECPKIIYQYDGDGPSQYCEEGGAMYWDGSGYIARFATTGTFGCVHGEK